MRRLALALLFVLSARLPSQAAIAVVNCASKTLASGASTTLAYGSNVTAGSVLVAGGFDFNSSATPASPTITSSNNGTWTVRKYAQLTADANVEGFLATKDNATAGADTVTWDPNGSADMGGLFICEVTGATNPSLDVVPATSQQANTDTPSIASGTLAQANEVIFAVMTGATRGGTVTITGDGTYTELVNNGDNGTSQMGQAQYKIVATTTSDQADWTISGDTGGGQFTKVSILISLKEAGGSPPACTPTMTLLGVGRCG